MIDMLHHATNEEVDRLLSEVSRASKNIIIKDNFEQSLYSRITLQMLDFLGNFGYGISIPKKNTSHQRLLMLNSLEIIKIDTNIDFYSKISILGRIVRPNWRPIAHIKLAK
jgi:hypothetical protein